MSGAAVAKFFGEMAEGYSDKIDHQEKLNIELIKGMSKDGSDTPSFSIGEILGPNKVISAYGDSPFEITNKSLRYQNAESMLNEMANTWTKEDWEKIAQSPKDQQKILALGTMVQDQYTEGLYSGESYHGMKTLRNQPWMNSNNEILMSIQDNIKNAQNLNGVATEFGAGAAFKKKERRAKGATTTQVEIDNSFAESVDGPVTNYVINNGFNDTQLVDFSDKLAEQLIANPNSKTTVLGDLSLMLPERLMAQEIGARSQQGKPYAEPLTSEQLNTHKSIAYAGKSFGQSANLYFKIALGDIKDDGEGGFIFQEGTLLAGSGANLKTLTENWLDPQFGFVNSIVRPIKDLISNPSKTNPYGGWTFGTQDDIDNGRLEKTYRVGNKELRVRDALNEIREKGLAASSEALLIGMAFQLAIANQDFQGGKAVSDADFQNSFFELTGSKQKSGNFLTNPVNIFTRLKLIKQARDKVLRRTVPSEIISSTPNGKGMIVSDMVLTGLDNYAERNDMEKADLYYPLILPNEENMWNKFDQIAEIYVNARGLYDDEQMRWQEGSGPNRTSDALQSSYDAGVRLLREQLTNGGISQDEFNSRIAALKKQLGIK